MERCSIGARRRRTRRSLDGFRATHDGERAHRGILVLVEAQSGREGSRPLLGREAELRAIDEAVDAARAGHGRLLLAVGEPGLGKTRLADEAAARAAAHGFRVVWGRCWESGIAPAYFPWTQALGELARGPRENDLAAPSLGEPSEDAFARFAEVHAFLRSVSRARPTLLVLDDLHAADHASLELLHFVARSLRGARLFVFGTYRDVEARLAPEIGARVARIVREGTVLRLRRLDPTETARLVAESGGAADLAHAVFDASQGNPLFAEEMTRLAIARGTVDARVVPDGVREIIRGRLSLIGDGACRLLEAASILGREFETREAAAISGFAEGELEILLSEAQRAGIVEPRREHFEFTHVLYRDTLYESLAVDTRRALHRAMASRISASDDSGEGPRLVAFAYHALEGGDATRSMDGIVRAAEWAIDRQAHEDAASLLERALAEADVDGIEPSVRYAALLALGRARIGAGRIEAGIRACSDAATLGRTLGDPVRVARAALAYGQVIRPGARDDVLVALLEEALAALPESESSIRAAVLGRLAGALQPSIDPNEPIALARQAVELARRSVDKRLLCTVLHGAGAALAAHAEPGERVKLGEEHERVALALGDRSHVLRARRRLVFAYLELGRLDDADRTLEAFESVARALDRPHELWPLHAMRSARALMHGRIVEAEELANEAAKLAEDIESSDAKVTLACQRLMRLLALERIGEARAFRPELSRILESSDPTETQMKYFDMLVEFRSSARIERGYMTDMFTYMSYRGAPRTPSPHFAEVLAACGDAERNAALVERLASSRDHLACSAYSMTCEAPIAHSLGILARALGRTDDAVRELEHAEARATSLGLSTSLVRIRLALGGALAERNRSGDAVAARRALAAARDGASNLGLDTLAERIERDLGRQSRVESPGTSAIGATPALGDGVGTNRRAVSASRVPSGLTLVREGEVWTVTFDGASFRLKDSRGVRALSRLVESPGREFHALELAAHVADAVDGGDAGELLDRRAIDDYRGRVEALNEVIEEAEGFGDVERAARAKEERELIATELSRAVAKGGQGRRAGSAAERARTAVQRRLRDAIERIGEHSPALAAHLEQSIRTGTYCSYEPEGRRRSPKRSPRPG